MQVAQTLLLLMQVFLQLLLALPQVSPDTQAPRLYSNPVYGLAFTYGEDWHFVREYDTGASHLAVFASSSFADPARKFYLVIQNLGGMSLNDWLADQERDFMGSLWASSSLTLDGVEGLQRVYRTADAYHLAAYFAKHDKVYLLNVGPFGQSKDASLPASLQDFRWFDGDFPQPVPLAPSAGESPFLRTPETQPALQFPFCGTWKITNGYYFESPGHQNDQYNRYALDWVNNNDPTYQQPVYAAHRGSVSTKWDSAGGGNLLMLTYTDDASYQTWYAHLYDFGVTSGTVTAGTQVGRADCTGTACTDNHLHFALLQNNWSILPEPMSGESGFAPGQTHTRNCGICCGCLPIACCGLAALGCDQRADLKTGATSFRDLWAPVHDQIAGIPLASPTPESFPTLAPVRPTPSVTAEPFPSVLTLTRDVAALTQDVSEGLRPSLVSRESGWDRSTPQAGGGSHFFNVPQEYTTTWSAATDNRILTWDEAHAENQAEAALPLSVDVGPPSSASYRIVRSVLGMGGGAKTSASYRVDGTSGQLSETGVLSSANYKVRLGFWSGLSCALGEFSGPSRISIDGSVVTLQWNGVAGASVYRIYRGSNPYFLLDEPYASTGDTTWTDLEGGGDPSVNHYYVVRAANTCGESSMAYRVGELDFAVTPGN